MELNSCLYECNVMHCRIEPKRHAFNHSVFMLYLDLDEIDRLDKDLTWFSRNRFNVFSFFDKDHMEYGGANVRENITAYLRSKGVDDPVGRIMLLTNVRVWGYIFNPVCFYYCFRPDGSPLCVVPEICNTFRELKPFLLGPETFDGQQFVSKQVKYFYISPFIDLDVPMDFRIRIPGEKFTVRIDDLKEDRKFFYSTLSGHRQPLTSGRLAWFALKYPLLTLKVIGLIHWHAGILHYFKKIPYHKKASNPHLQREVQREYTAKKV